MTFVQRVKLSLPVACFHENLISQLLVSLRNCKDSPMTPLASFASCWSFCWQMQFSL